MNGRLNQPLDSPLNGTFPPTAGLELNGLIWIEGDSNAVGQGVASNDDSGLGHVGHDGTTVLSYASSTIDTHISTSLADPPTYTDVAYRLLQSYAGTGSPGGGIELALGRALVTYGIASAPADIVKHAINGSSMLHWRPSGTYPTTPPRLYTTSKTYLDAQIAARGRPLGVVIKMTGENDAAAQADADAWTARQDEWEADMRATYGSRWLLVEVLANSAMTASPRTPALLAQVRAAQVAWVNAHSANAIYVDPDRVPVSSGALHYIGDEYWTLGNMVADAIARKWRGSAYSNNLGSGPAPWIQSVGEPTVRASSGTTNLKPRAPAGARAGDIEVLVHGTFNADPSPTPSLVDAQGFVAVSSSPVLCTFTTSRVYIAVYTRTVDQSTLDANGGYMPTPTVSGAATSDTAWIFSVRGSSGLDTNGGNANNANGTAVSITGVNTTAADCLLTYIQVTFCGSRNDATSFVDASLAGFGVLRDSIRNTNMKITLASGTLATPGPSGAVTGSRLAASMQANIVLAFKP